MNKKTRDFVFSSKLVDSLRGGVEENLLRNLLWGGVDLLLRNVTEGGGGEGVKKRPKWCYVINEWPLIQ